MNVTFKQKVYSCCQQQLNTKIQNLQLVLDDLKEGAESDAKSSAGDKHETARAMMQIEQEKISSQLREFKKQKNDLEKIDINTPSLKIINGSLIKANNSYFFLSVAIGKVNVEEIPVMMFSTQSPMGQKMLGHKKGDLIEMNGITYRIEAVE